MRRVRFLVSGLAVGAGIWLVSCSSLNDAQGSCSAANADYSQMWWCIRGRVSSGTAGMMNNEMGIRYMAFGDAIDEKYKAGQISNADAKLMLAQELSRGNAEFNARYKPTTCTTSAVFNTLQTRCY